ncbi:endonuclease/exonuclease/phosphatase family protein, partial [Cooperia oncophora]
MSSLQETKAKETATRKTNDGHLIVLGAKLSGRNVGGVGFLVHHRLEHMVDSVEVIGPRLAILRLRIDKRTFVSIINCYAPTSAATDEEKDAFYKELEEMIKRERSYYKYVVGDFNASECDLFHGNSFFTKKEDRRWTWESPNATTHSEIDHVLTNRKWSLLDVSVVDAFRTGSDHRLVRAKIRLRARIRRRDFFRPPPIRLPHYDTNVMEAAAAHYTWQEAQDLSQDYTMLIEGLLHCAMASAITTRTDSKGRIDDKARALLQQRAVVHRNPASTPLERAIEEWEVEHALRQMKPGKAPGPDRISVDFLKSASRTVIKQLTRRYN